MSVIFTVSIILGVIILLIAIQAMVQTEKPIKKAVCGILKGLCAMMAVNISGMFTGITLPVSILSLAVAVFGGIPGVTTMVILDMIF